jgi:hypothetical protein
MGVIEQHMLVPLTSRCLWPRGELSRRCARRDNGRTSRHTSLKVLVKGTSGWKFCYLGNSARRDSQWSWIQVAMSKNVSAGDVRWVAGILLFLFLEAAELGVVNLTDERTHAATAREGDRERARERSRVSMPASNRFSDFSWIWVVVARPDATRNHLALNGEQHCSLV